MKGLARLGADGPSEGALQLALCESGLQTLGPPADIGAATLAAPDADFAVGGSTDAKKCGLSIYTPTTDARAIRRVPNRDNSGILGLAQHLRTYFFPSVAACDSLRMSIFQSVRRAANRTF